MSGTEQTFYAVAAQVIPVLFLVAAIERRLIPQNEPKSYRAFITDLVWAPLTVLMMAVGEVAAIHALVRDESTRMLEFLTVVSLALSGVMVVVQAISASFDAIEERANRSHSDWVPAVEKARAVTRMVVIGLVFVVGAAYIAADA